MAKNFRYKHYSTNVADKVPNPNDLNVAEIAVNVADGGEKIFIKNTDNEIVTFIPENQVVEKINSGIENSELIQSLIETINQLRSDLDTLSISVAEDLNEVSDNLDTLSISVVEDIDDIYNKIGN